MKVSFITTVRNEAATIGPYLESLARQTRPPDEVVIVDGGSTDGTAEAIRSRAHLFPVCTVVVEPCNIAAGRNLAVSHASGDVIAMSDGGCLLPPTWLETLVRPLEQDETLDISGGGWTIAREPGLPDVFRWFYLKGRPGFAEGPQNPLMPSSRSFAIRREAWIELGGQPDFLYAGEDTLFNFKWRIGGLRSVFVPEAAAAWRMHRSLRAFRRQLFNYARAHGHLGRREAFSSITFHGKAFAAYALALAAAAASPLFGSGLPAVAWGVAWASVLATLVIRRKGRYFLKAREYGFGVLRSAGAVGLTFIADWLAIRGSLVGLHERGAQELDMRILEYVMGPSPAARARPAAAQGRRGDSGESACHRTGR
jgi:GT2 family glycosyltransferase